MTGNELIAELKKKYDVRTDRELALTLGISVPVIQKWKSQAHFTPRQFVGLLDSAAKAKANRSLGDSLRPIVEFLEIELSTSRQGSNYELFKTLDDNDIPRHYFSGVKGELETKHGVYVFFDSRGQPIYVGKAKKQNLWREMIFVMNKTRGAVQSIKRVDHPEKNITYRNTDEKFRQIINRQVPLWDMARYFSAYEVANPLIDDIEALLIRCFANSLLNIKIERFTRHKQLTA